MDGLVKIFLDSVDCLWVIIICFEIAAHHLNNRCRILFPRWEGELVRPDGLVPERLLIGFDAFRDQATSSLRDPQAPQDVTSSLAFERLSEFGIRLDLFFDFPQFLN